MSEISPSLLSLFLLSTHHDLGMPPSPAASDYGSELSWDSAAEAALVQLEHSLAPTTTTTPPSLNSAPTTAKQHVEVAIEGAEEGERETGEQGEEEAARLAEVLRDFGVAVEEGEQVGRRSLWERFRKNRGWGALSLSDLSGPSWCEVQHSYRLASKPYLPPSERPASVLSSSGASIPINPRRTEAREKVLDGGKAVHARIEREVMGEQEKVEVKVEGGEEWWALRVLNTLVCLETLLETGRVREVPVVGWVHGFLVFGVIDEIERREFPLSPSSPAPPDSAPPASAPSTSLPPPQSSSSRRDNHKASPPTPKKENDEKDAQRTLEQFFSPVSSPSKGGIGKGKEKAADRDAVLDLTADAKEHVSEREEAKIRTRTGLVLSDTKTRYNPTIPPPSESRAARLQLMLYHRLLTALLQPEPPPVVFASDLPSPPPTAQGLEGPPLPFSWTRLYAQLDLDPEAPLSDAFLASIQPIFLPSPLLGSVLSAASTLAEYVAALVRFGELLRGGKAPDRLLEGEMEIVYRLRDGAGGGGGKGWRGRRSAGRARRGGEQRSKAQEKEREREDEERELQRAIELSLQESSAAAAPPPPPDECAVVVDELPAVVEPVEPDTVDSQLENTQLPFFANPSLPLPLPLVETDTLASASQAASLPSTAQQFDLPINSQGSPASSLPSPAVATRGRYNLRRRPPPSFVGVEERTMSSSPGRKRLRSTKEEPDDAPQVAPAARTPRPASPTPVSVPPANDSSSTPAASSPASSSSSSSSAEPDPDPSYIGTSTFPNSPSELASWVGSVVRYWRGERAPVGVSLGEVGRCRTCEFEEGCEWRAMKAEEAVEQARARKAARAAAKQSGGGAAVG